MVIVQKKKLQVWVHPRPWLNAILLPLDAPQLMSPILLFTYAFSSRLCSQRLFMDNLVLLGGTMHITHKHYIEKSLKAPVLTR